MKWGEQLLQMYTKCIICGTKNDLEPHHMLKTNPYEELHDSISNGIVLCHKHHHEYHQKYNSEISFNTLLKYKEEYERNRCKKLNKENNLLHSNLRNLREEYKTVEGKLKEEQKKNRKLKRKLKRTLKENEELWENYGE